MEGVLTVTTSQQLTGENLKSFVKFDPGLNYTLNVNDEWIYHYAVTNSMLKKVMHSRS